MFAQPAVKAFRRLFERMLPRVCQVCESIISVDEHSNHSICSDCIEQADPLPIFQAGNNFSWPLCGEPMPASLATNRCLACVVAPLSVRYLRTAFWYDNSIETAIKLMKYAERRLIASDLGRLIANYLDASFADSDSNRPHYDILVAVPSPLASLRARRFSHTHQMAKVVAAKFQLPLIYDLLVSTDRTAPQAGLSPVARQRNAESAFLLNDAFDLKEAKVLLVDDVITTGSTINACSEILLAAGARIVDGVTVARSRQFRRHRLRLRKPSPGVAGWIKGCNTGPAPLKL